jgi:hypothetical protein
MSPSKNICLWAVASSKLNAIESVSCGRRRTEVFGQPLAVLLPEPATADWEFQY